MDDIQIELVYTVDRTNKKTGHIETSTHTISDSMIKAMIKSYHNKSNNRKDINDNDVISIIDII